MLFDTNVNLGVWPFTLVPELNAPRLAAHLRAHGIGRAVVSPTAAILAPDPMPANRALLAAVRGAPALLPVPVVNPALAHWREQLDAAAAGPLRAIKLYPNYHNYRLDSPRFDPFFAEVKSRRLRLLISVRLEDERHRYFGLHIKSVPPKTLIAFLRRQPQLHPLVLGLGLPDLRIVAKDCENFSTDTSFLEWLNSLLDLTREFPARRIFLGSHTPFFVTRASVAKVTTAPLPARTIAAIGGGNAARFFSL
jgi:predicted TIM-barrel fold metal-dependent hydrolase